MAAFLNMVRTMRDRNWGGTLASQVAEPYVSGYHFTKWYMPDLLAKYIQKGFAGAEGSSVNDAGTIKDKDSAANVLAATCLSVTPPGGTLNKTEHNGLGGVKWSTPTNVDYGNELSCKFLEMSGLPIMRIIGGWVKLIRDNKIGLGPLIGSEYAKNNYAATVFYWTTKPDGKTVEFSSCYSGVFPTKDPQDLFTGDVASVDKLEMDITFNVDFVWHEDWVSQKCQQLANQCYGGDNNRAGYISGDGHRYTAQYAENFGNP